MQYWKRFQDTLQRLDILRLAIMHRIGFRGAVLGCLANFDFVWAYSLFDNKSAILASRAPAYSIIFGLLHPKVWGTLLILIGILCSAQSFVEDDRAAFAAAWMIKLTWVILILAAWPRAGIQILRLVVFFITLAGLVFIVSRWPEPSRAPRVEG